MGVQQKGPFPNPVKPPRPFVGPLTPINGNHQKHAWLSSYIKVFAIAIISAVLVAIPVAANRPGERRIDPMSMTISSARILHGV